MINVCLDEKSQNETHSQVTETTWVTMSDVKLQAVKGMTHMIHITHNYDSKEFCYEVALGDFDMPQAELEELAKTITTTVTKRWGKTDPCFEESWRSVLRDAADTIGLEITVSEPEVQNNKENDRLKAKLDEVSKREQIKDMELAQLRAKVTMTHYDSHI